MSEEIDKLTHQFNTLLTEYRNTYDTYKQVIQSGDNSFTHVDESTFISDNSLETTETSNVSACETSCSVNKGCSGATYNTSTKSCTLGSGNGQIVHASNSVAIVKQALFYTNRLKELNAELTSLNVTIINVSNEYYKTVNVTNVKIQEQDEIMMNNYDILLKERIEIENMVKQFQTLDTAYENGTIIVTSNYSYYMIFLFMVVILLLILIKVSVSQ